MKKAICAVLAAVICISLSGCGTKQTERTTQAGQGKSVNEVLSEKINEGDKSGSETTAGNKSEKLKDTKAANAKPVDIDLTKLSSTMVYSEVANMLTTPDDYTGKSVRMNGTFTFMEGQNRNYYACIAAYKPLSKLMKGKI